MSGLPGCTWVRHFDGAWRVTLMGRTWFLCESPDTSKRVWSSPGLLPAAGVDAAFTTNQIGEAT